MVDSVYRTRSLGVAAEGLPDQYADGKAAKVWEFYLLGERAHNIDIDVVPSTIELAGAELVT